MIGRTGPVTDRQTVSDRFRYIRLGRLNRVDEGPAPRQKGGHRGGKCAARAVRMRGLNEVSFEHVEESSVVEQVGGAFCQEVPALDEHVLTAETMDDFRRPAGIGERGNLDPGELLC